MISLIIAILLLCIVVYVAHLLIGMFNLPAAITQILYILVALVAIVVLLRHLGIHVG
jgi:hypothetical protein